MEDFLIKALQSGNVTGMLCSIILYLIIHVQRKNTATYRDSQIEDLQKVHAQEINKLKIEKELMEKDIEFLKDENSTVKSDIKEIKTTLQQIALSLATIAAKNENRESKGN